MEKVTPRYVLHVSWTQDTKRYKLYSWKHGLSKEEFQLTLN